MCLCELLLDSLDNISEKLTSQEYKNFAELIAEQHSSCTLRAQGTNLPDGGDRHHRDMITYWMNIKARSYEWSVYADHNIRILTSDESNSTNISHPLNGQFSDVLRFWKRIDAIRLKP